MIKFEDIKKVNETISTIDVKGKNYAEVNQRIKAFRMLYPAGTLETEILSVENGVCIMKATIKDDNDHILGIGHAYEKENSTFINKTSYIENCETSAVGRALAMCGIGIDTSVASYEEVANAIENQKPKNDKVTEAQKSLIKNNFNIPQVKEYCANKGITKLSQLKKDDADALEKMIFEAMEKSAPLDINSKEETF